VVQDPAPHHDRHCVAERSNREDPATTAPGIGLVRDVARYRWSLGDARQLKALEDENAKLKKLLAEAMLDNAMLKVINSKNGDVRREA
jgi:hypothetical protein